MYGTHLHSRRSLLLVSLLALGACAGEQTRETSTTPVVEGHAASQDKPELGRVYLRLDGSGAAPEDEFMPPEHERYLAILEQSLEASGLFHDVSVMTGSAVPRNGLVIDVQLDARIDADHSSANAALFFIFPVHTEGTVHSRFELHRGTHTLATFEYDDRVVTRVVPAAELAGRTWVEKGGSLTRLARRMTTDLAHLLARQGATDAYVARELETDRPRG